MIEDALELGVVDVIQIAEQDYIWPVENHYGLSALYGSRVHPVTGEVHEHNGIDIIADLGTPVRAVASGTVTKAEYDWELGDYILLTHEDNSGTLYAQLEECKVQVGDCVTQGQTIGTVGTTGMSTGPHLHFECLLPGSSSGGHHGESGHGGHTDPLMCYGYRGNRHHGG